MIPEIGHYALILALCVAVVQGCLPIYGAAVGNSSLMAVAKPAARGQFLLVLLAFCCLGYAFADKEHTVTLCALLNLACTWLNVLRYPLRGSLQREATLCQR